MPVSESGSCRAPVLLELIELVAGGLRIATLIMGSISDRLRRTLLYRVQG